MQRWLATALCAAVILAGAMAFLTPADSRGRGAHAGGGGHAGAGRQVNRNVDVNRNVNRNINRNVDRRVDRNGRRGYWRNGVWVTVPAVAGYVAACAYEYGRWQSTGSSYWRDRYYECAQ